LLPDGKVLVAGGFGTTNTSDSAFVFDPESGTNGRWTTVRSLNIGRWRHSAILLPNGKVLVVGGEDKDFDFLKSAEICDPATRQWTATQAFPLSPDRGQAATLMPNGEVVVTLDNGQVWTELSASSALRVKTGDTVRIEAGTLRSFILVTPNGHSGKVKRIK